MGEAVYPSNVNRSPRRIILHASEILKMHRFWVREAGPKVLSTVWFYWYKVQEEREVIDGHTNWTVVASAGGEWLAGAEQDGTNEGDIPRLGDF